MFTEKNSLDKDGRLDGFQKFTRVHPLSVLHFLFWVSNHIMECGPLRLKLNCGQPRWSPTWICTEANAGCCVDPKWRLFPPMRKRYPPTAPAPIRMLVSFPKRFRPERPHIVVKGRSETARMGWRRGLNRNKISSFDGLHSPKQTRRFTNGMIKVRSLYRRWTSYAVKEFSWIFYCFFFGRLFLVCTVLTS